MTISVEWHQPAIDALVASREVGNSVEQVAEQAAGEMARRAPRDDAPDHLADHIVTSTGQDAASVYTDVGIDDGRFFYWRFVEFGTKNMAAEPFVRPALSRTYTV